MKVLSLFDGIACARVALERAGIRVEAYFASEIDKYAVEVAKKNYPDIVELGDIKTIGYDAGQFCRIENGQCNTLGVNYMEDIDLMIGGSPCQDLSISKMGRQGLDGTRSNLFFEYVRIRDEVKPKWWILENVASMSDEARDKMSEVLGVQPILIDAALVSAQERRRYFWTNIPNVQQPTDRGITLQDILIPESEKPRRFLEIKQPLRHGTKGVSWDTSGNGHYSQQNRARYITGKSPTVPTCRTVTKTKVFINGRVGELHPEEMERLQGLPDRYTEGIKSKEKRGGAIGNGFNVEVVAHILKAIPQK